MPLQERKTYLNKSSLQSSAKGKARRKMAGSTILVPTPRELNAFHQLQKEFAHPRILHYFNDSL